MIREDIRQLPHDETIKSSDILDLQALQNLVPSSLMRSMSSLQSAFRSKSAEQKKYLLQTSLVHALVNIAAKQTYVSLLLLSVGLFIHLTTRSRVIIHVLFSLGFCATYSQVVESHNPAMTHASQSPTHGLVALKEGEFCQWVADNFNHNEDSSSGHETTHVIVIISCQNSASEPQYFQPILQQKATTSDLVMKDTLGDMIQRYRRSANSNCINIQFQ